MRWGDALFLEQMAFLAGITLIAILFDIVFLRWLGRRVSSDKRSADDVYFGGRYSPFLTEIKKTTTALSRILTFDNIKTALLQFPLKAYQYFGRFTTMIKQLPQRLQSALAYLFLADTDVEVSAYPVKPLTLKTILVDLGALLIVVLAFGWAMVDLTEKRTLTGTEWDLFATQDMILRNSILNYRTFPIWNPYINGGFPYVADPFLHIFNPFFTIPVLVLGEVGGTKMALLLAFLIAGIGQYLLGYYLGLGRFARLWSAAVFMMNGQFVARFLQGHYNFQPTASWIPLVFLSAVMCFKSNHRWPVLVGSAAAALMWLSGNPYYPLYVASALLPVAAISAINIDINQPSFRINWRGVMRLAVMATLALALSSLSLLPQLEMTPRLAKPIEPGLKGSQPPHAALINFLADDVRFADSDLLGKIPIDEEYYIYIGLTPFIFMMFAPLAFRKGRRRELLALTSAVVVMFLWADSKNTFIADLYQQFPYLENFRYPSRALILGATLFPLIGAYGLDEIIKRIQSSAVRLRIAWAFEGVAADEGAERKATVSGLSLSLLALSIVVVIALSGLWDVFQANSRLITTAPRFTGGDKLLDWLQQTDRSTYYLNSPISNGWHQPIVRRGFYWINAWYAWGLREIPSDQWDITIPSLKINGKYLIVAAGQVPLEPDAKKIEEINGNVVYRLPSSPPFAFLYRDTALPEKTIEVSAQWTSPNELAMTADGQVGDSLVTMVNFYPGWSVIVDDRPQPVLNASGFLGVTAQPGVHTYRFTFSPLSFRMGLMMSGFALALVIGLVFYQRRRPPGN